MTVRFTEKRGLFTGLLFGITTVFVLILNANAQCPGGKPPNPDGSCGNPPAKRPAPVRKPIKQPVAKKRPVTATIRNRPPAAANTRKKPVGSKRPIPIDVLTTCSINVHVTGKNGEPFPSVNLVLNDPSLSSGVTDATGSFVFDQLVCRRNYTIIPSHPEMIFDPSSASISTLLRNSSTTIIGVMREGSESRIATSPCNPPPNALPQIKFSDSVTGKLSPQTSWCEEAGKDYFHSYQLTGAVGGDIVRLDLQSEQSTDLRLQVFEQSGNKIEFDPADLSGETSVKQVVLPQAGDYILRVIESSANARDYRLTVTRSGLSDEGYRQQLERVYAALGEPGKPAFYRTFNYYYERLRSSETRPAADEKFKNATGLLERLNELDPSKPEAVAMLFFLSFYHRKDFMQANELAVRTLSLGGEVRFRVNYGEKLDKSQRRVTHNIHPSWLIIRKGSISVVSFIEGEGEIFTSNQKLLKKKDLNITDFNFGLTIYGKGIKENKYSKDTKLYETKSFDFVPMSALDLNAKFPLNEVSTMKTLIKKFVKMER
ncbi:MAG: hypothetical protein L0220_26535 [Acidobacteria bacterium]|nr:hypothetical protein [Acidobacteriota bacterium]